MRIAFLESVCGWTAGWLYRMDHHFQEGGVFADSGLLLKPGECFRRQRWVSYEPVEGCLAHLAEYLGHNKILWATDYPDPDGFFPGASAMVVERLPENLRHQVLAESALQSYKMV